MAQAPRKPSNPRIVLPDRKPSGPSNRSPSFIDRYVIQSELGRGRNSIVYRAHDPQDKQTVAIKTIYPGDGLNEIKELADAVFREAERLRQLAHKNILAVRDAGVADGYAYMVMPYVAGVRLEDALREQRLRRETALVVMTKVARAVHHAHQRGLIHRDLKPGNIMLDAANEPYVLDFGLSWQRGARSQASLQSIVGTPAYMSPEQARGEETKLTPAADVYSLGAILYEVVAKRPPFVAETSWKTLQLVMGAAPEPLKKFDPAVSDGLERIVGWCLEKEPTKRYVSAEALAADLDRLQANKPPKGPGLLFRKIF